MLPKHRKLEQGRRERAAPACWHDGWSRANGRSARIHLRDPEAYFAAKVAATKVANEFCDAGLPVVTVLRLRLPDRVIGTNTTSHSGRILADALFDQSFSVSCRRHQRVDVEDVAERSPVAWSGGVVGERYTLGGENLTFSQLFETLVISLA